MVQLWQRRAGQHCPGRCIGISKPSLQVFFDLGCERVGKDSFVQFARKKRCDILTVKRAITRHSDGEYLAIHFQVNDRRGAHSHWPTAGRVPLTHCPDKDLLRGLPQNFPLTHALNPFWQKLVRQRRFILSPVDLACCGRNMVIPFLSSRL